MSPNFVEDVLGSARGVPITGRDGEPRLSFVGGSVEVITENGIVGYGDHSMSSYNTSVLEVLHDAIDEFVRGLTSVDDVQRSMATALDLLEREATSNLHDSIRRAEADLEHIRFAMQPDEQRTAAVSRLDPLRAAIAERLRVGEGRPS